jgi:light-regulated signal transduction histidine kinase (bacteriophytochrome)
LNLPARAGFFEESEAPKPYDYCGRSRVPKGAKGRQIEIQTGDIPPCRGAPTLLTQVWINLVANALKYTRKRERAVIEIGCDSNNEEDVYFVRDNGTGFDVRYADQIFGVFQRLHCADEYEGTGVGLAIV